MALEGVPLHRRSAAARRGRGARVLAASWCATAWLALVAPLAGGAGVADLSSADATGGLKEALASGASFAVERLGVTDGFLRNDRVRIPLPAGLSRAEQALRMFGLGAQADELILRMNRAAEAAVTEAKPVFLKAIQEMTVMDAKNILVGGETAGTDYFRRVTAADLRAKFLPIVQQATSKVQLADQYNAVAGPAARFGMVSEREANLDGYVTERALDGLFYMVAEQEKAIRKDPLGQSSGLLRKVFGALR